MNFAEIRSKAMRNLNQNLTLRIFWRGLRRRKISEPEEPEREEGRRVVGTAALPVGGLPAIAG